MEKITINKGKKMYEIKSIRPISAHVMQVVFADNVPSEYGDISLYTSGDIQCAYLPGYDTVYRDEGKTVYLSDDGSVYAPPKQPEGSEPVLPSEPYVPTAEELLTAALAQKKAEVSQECEQIIYRGVTVTLSDGSVEHFRRTEHDQINLFGKQAQQAAGANQLE